MNKSFLLHPFCLAAVLLSAMPGDSTAQDTVHTNRKSEQVLPLPKQDGMFHFLIYGDRTGGPPEGLEVLRRAVADTNLLDPDMVMTVGDFVNGYTGREVWIREAEEYKGIMKGLRMPWFPVAGNHDIYWRGPDRPPEEHEGDFEKHFGPLWYWFKHKDCGFVCLFSDEGDPAKGPRDFTSPAQTQMSPAQMEWLKQSLTEMKGLRHVFVFLHHPRWIEKTYPGSNWNAVHSLLAAAGNVRAVFAGHIHRLHYGGKRDGIEYFALATTGGSMPGRYPGAGYVHHMNLVTVRPDGFVVSILPVGEVMDPRLFTPERQADIDKARNIHPVIASPKIKVGTDGLGAALVQMNLTNPSTRAVEMEIVPETGNDEWFYAPEHLHTRLEAGEAKSLTLTVARVRQGFDQGFSVPAFAVRADYLAEGARVPLPPRRVTLPVALRPPPEEFFAPGGENSVLELDGHSALRVEMGASELPDGPFTVEAWVKSGNANQTAPFIAKTEQSEFALNLSNGVPGFHCFLGGKYFSAIAPTDQPIPAETWAHVAGVWDGKELRLYVDGKRRAAVPASGPRTTNVLPLYIGADPNAKSEPGMFFTGALDEIRLSTAARYEADFEPQSRFASDAQTLYLFHCDKQLGPFVPSHSASGRYATKSGNPQFRVKN
ncbi:MAG: metallophosphoesterase [Verrucomicrobiales bacterium]|nr:metallophosphoesterase [Verrucomicrobiales bacterium]